MKAALISDIHFMNKSKFNPVLNEYDGIIFPLVNLEYTYRVAELKNCDYVIILGDVIDRSNVSSYLAQKLFTFFKSVKIPTIIILGNHDISTVDNEYYSFVKLLEEINPDIQVFDEPGSISSNIVCVPYAYREAIITNESLYDKILLTHIGISECLVSDGKRVLTDFSLSSLEKYVKVITGHYHYPQEIENVLVVGSPWEVKKDEFEDKDKRIVVYDFDKLSYQSLPSIRKKLEVETVSSFTEFSELLKRVEEKLVINPYAVTKIRVPFQLPKNVIEKVETKFGSTIMIEFITETDDTNDRIVNSLKQLESLDVGKIDLKELFLEYVASSVSLSEYELVQKHIMEVVNNVSTGSDI